MELKIAEQQANALMTKHGLTQQGWTFQWDNAKRRFGRCVYIIKIINLSKPLVVLNDESTVIDVILHEIAHALVGPDHGHDRVWQRKCIEIGAKPERCYDAEDVSVPEHKYSATCGKCKRVYKRHRLKKSVLKAYCPCTHTNRFELKWVES